VNIVLIKIQNKTDLDLESIFLEFNGNNLPEGITLSKRPQRIDVSSSKTSDESIEIQIEVNERISEGIYDLLFTLKDILGHSWDYKITSHINVACPEKYELIQNYPNPFNTGTQIKYSLAAEQDHETRLIIYDLLGKHIYTLINKKQSSGTYMIKWDGRDETGNKVASGIYFYKLTSGPFVKTNKMVLLY